MNRYTPRKRAEIVKFFYQNNLSFIRIFPGRLISKNADIAYPPWSPDLTVSDFCLLGYLKDRVFVNNHRTLKSLKDNIREEIDRIPPEMLEKVMKNILKRVHYCINAGGVHLVDIVFSV
ncbi:unnamed protein product [Psylliodes chrysocephalus]|uniref:Uncharacterized protein n=1 Tax=Psylliodes chrysocephalus TaxID=3402493 RepID=A0A9P0D4D2_9CUCU|nr:unnamed protein product [Psylliodes chrysocephala]